MNIDINDIKAIEKEVLKELDERGRPSNHQEGSEQYTEKLKEIMFFTKSIARKSLALAKELEGKGRFYMDDLTSVAYKLKEIDKFLK